MDMGDCQFVTPCRRWGIMNFLRFWWWRRRAPYFVTQYSSYWITPENSFRRTTGMWSSQKDLNEDAAQRIVDDEDALWDFAVVEMNEKSKAGPRDTFIVSVYRDESSGVIVLRTVRKVVEA